MMGLFEPRRANERKGRGGQTHIGFWATQAEQETVRALANERGYSAVADYFRALIRDDITAHGEAHGTPPLS